MRSPPLARWDWKEKKEGKWENDKWQKLKNFNIEELKWQNLISIISSFVIFIASYSTILIHDIPNRGFSVIFHLSCEELFLEILHVMALLIFHQRNFRKICRNMRNFNIHVYLIEIWMLRVTIENLRAFLVSYPKFMIASCLSKVKSGENNAKIWTTLTKKRFNGQHRCNTNTENMKNALP